MDRRQFIERAAAAAAVLPITNAAGEAGQSAARSFKLKYAPHIGMFEQSAGKDPLDQIRFMADNGFRAFEDNGMMARTPDLQQAMGDLLAKRGMTMGVFVIDGGDNWKVSLATGKPEFKEVFLKACRTSVEVAKRCGAKWMTVVPGYFARELPLGIQTGHVLDALRAGADILAPHNLTMVLEPLSDNPDLFLRTSDQAYGVCRAINSPACKILFDMYHIQRNTGRIVTNLDWAWDEIGYLQIGDVPDRNEPGTGEVHYQYIFKHIHAKAAAAARDIVLGMEHGNSRPGKDGEREVIEAYVRADAFAV